MPCLGLFFGRDGLHIPHDLLDERVTVQLFGSTTWPFTIPRSARASRMAMGRCCQNGPAPPRVEPVLLDELGDPALHFGPGHIARRAVHRHREGREIIAVLLPQPGGGILFTGMVLHVADNRVLALNIAVPFLDGGVDLRLGQRPAHRFRLRSGVWA